MTSFFVYNITRDTLSIDQCVLIIQRRLSQHRLIVFYIGSILYANGVESDQCPRILPQLIRV